MAWTFLGLSAFAQTAAAQVFTYGANELVLGFRKTGANQGNYYLVADIGAGSTYLNLAPGATMSVPNFTTGQLSDSFTDLNNLNWSVLGDPGSSLSGYPNNTLWLTVPRTNTAVQSPAPPRLSYAGQQSVKIKILGVFDGASTISSEIVADGDNTATAVREPVDLEPMADLNYFVGGGFDATASTLRDTWVQNVENTTPASFTSAVRSDLYEIRPLTDGQGNPIVDPHTGQSTGAGYYVGYFQLNTDGTMSFTRASVSGPPPAPQLNITRTSTTSTISFLSANQATYTLYYTNSSGLSQPIANWPSSPTTIIGNGGNKSFIDTSADPNRFYRVRGQ